ncbi:unnamed protein product [Hymenolepis diminuta]|uniref:Uncharacterized protein n=1 Tax=Hymenolepis diminuta TaxID=6216 RepID=A0A564Y1M0_HYMDI|nr:unnamed protein product [Hymenolepis diminuta]
MDKMVAISHYFTLCLLVLIFIFHTSYRLYNLSYLFALSIFSALIIICFDHASHNIRTLHSRNHQ